jgi:uncharacterized membrane-anchored protein
VAFSTIFATFRQALGGIVSKYDVLLTRSILHLGFMVVLGALLPPLFQMLGFRPGLVPRVSSAIVGIFALAFNVTYPARRRAATGRATPTKVWMNLILIYIAVAVLLASAAGAPIKTSIASHALGLTLLLVSTFIAFLLGLDLLPREHARPLSKQAGSTGSQR